MYCRGLGYHIYCNAGVLTAVGEAKVRAGRRDVEKTFERAQELLRRWLDKLSSRLVPVLYTVKLVIWINT